MNLFGSMAYMYAMLPFCFLYLIFASPMSPKSIYKRLYRKFSAMGVNWRVEGVGIYSYFAGVFLKVAKRKRKSFVVKSIPLLLVTFPIHSPFTPKI